jgi:hypothetical protein
MGRPRTNSPWDPPNPRTVRGRMIRERALMDILFWSHMDTPKSKVLEENPEWTHQVRLTTEEMETMIDLNRMWEAGMFGLIPEVVAERLLADRIVGRTGNIKGEKVTFDNIGDPDKVLHIPPAMMVRMGLEVLRLYLMGVDPYMRSVIRRVLTQNGHTLSLKRVMHGVSHSAAVLEGDYEVEDDDDFDFSGLDDIEFD